MSICMIESVELQLLFARYYWPNLIRCGQFDRNDLMVAQVVLHSHLQLSTVSQSQHPGWHSIQHPHLFSSVNSIAKLHMAGRVFVD